MTLPLRASRLSLLASCLPLLFALTWAPALAQVKASHGVSQDLFDLPAKAQNRQARVDAAQLDGALSVVRGDYVVIDAAAEDAAGLLKDLQALGLRDGRVYGHLVSGLLPLSRIEDLTAMSALRFARPAYGARATGNVDSEGDAAMRSDDVRSIYGIDGTGITVGTLSDSYNCLGGAPGDVTSDDLPTGVTVFSDLTTGCIDEGRAMMQIIHDVAPGVTQGFHTAFNGQADFALGIEELAGCPSGSAAGCTPVTGFAADVVNDDVFYFAEPFFQDGVIAQAVDNVVSNGIAYFALAGNHGRESYQAPFRTSTQTGPGGGTLHDFDPGAGEDVSQRISVPTNTGVVLSFQWVDRYFAVSGAPGAATDIDVYILDVAGNVLASRTTNNVGGDPIELFNTFTNPGNIDADMDGFPDTQFDVQIELVTGAAPALVKYIALVNGPIGNFAQVEWDTQSSTIYGHMNAALGETVGAAYYQSTPEFGTDPPVVEGFSSAGPTPIYFDVNGNAITPVTRNKPDIVAPDGGNNTFFGPDRDGDGNPNFSGTSAATPHAAAVGALLLEAAGGPGSLTPATVFANLESTAIDMDDPLTPGFDIGFDFRTGAGLISALEAVHLYLNAPPVADAGADISEECTSTSGATVALDGSASSDPEDDPLIYVWTYASGDAPGLVGTVIATGATPSVTLPLGTHVITLEVTDDGDESDTDDVEVTIVDTTPPDITLNGPATITLECGIDDYVELGAGATDVCDPAPLLEVDASAVDTGTPGTYSVVYTATDASGNVAQETRTVEVVDTTPPEIEVGADPITLWPPNHKYRTISLDDLELSVTDECDKDVSASDVVIASVTSDEPENAPGDGDGNTDADILVGATCQSVDLRAERTGPGNGRVYTLLLEVADASGNVGEASFQVHVPHDIEAGPLGVDDGPAYSVAGCDLSSAALASAQESSEHASKADDGARPVVTEASEDPADSGVGELAASREGGPAEYALLQNYPNPFTGGTVIPFELPEAADVSLRVVNVLGQEVAQLVDGRVEAGSHEVTLDARSLSAGVYVYVLRANGHALQRRMMLLD